MWATWTDDRCREVTVFSQSDGVSATPGRHIGPWIVTVDQPGGCGNFVLGSGACLGYEAPAADGSVGIQAMGIDRAIGDAIVRSIPL